MIQSFQNKELEKFFLEGVTKGIPQEFNKKIAARLEAIDSAVDIEDIRLPGYNLHELKGDKKGIWSIKISGNWRITFRFEGSEAYDVDLVDYH